jgi:2',3'-cyclic-nucleotide 2'-phosphodiesterase (5'-nucleotidase family)
MSFFLSHRRERRGRREHAIILFFLCALGVLCGESTLSAQSQHFTILHFNDLHGHLEAECRNNTCRGGAARIASVVKNIENENAAKGYKTILLFGGDAFSGTLISSEFKGEAEFRFLNSVGVDAMTLGNHEFDFGIAILEKRIQEAQFPVLSANTRFEHSFRLIAKPTAIIKEETGPSVGLIGLISDKTPHITKSKNVVGLVFDNPIKTAKHSLKELADTDIQIALTHMGVKDDTKLAKKVRGLDVVIGGHDHVSPDKYCRVVREIPVCQTPANGNYLGRLDLEIDGKEIHLMKSELIPLTENIPEDPKISLLVSGYSKKIDTKYGRVLGEARSNFFVARGRESPIGDLVADAMRAATDTNIAFINSGGVRASLQKGNVSLKNVAEVLPFDNYLVTFEITAKKIQKILDLSVSKKEAAFLQVSGVSFRIENGKAKDILINDAPLDPKKIYTATTVDFLMMGGDGYTILKSLPFKTLDVLVRDVLANYIREKKIIEPPSLTRITQQK